MAKHNARPSPKGRLPLQDWLVPVHYGGTEVTFPWLRRAHPGSHQSLEETSSRLGDADNKDHDDPNDTLAAAGEFIGRDALFHELETVCRRQKPVVLHGPAGAGKTEAAKAFGRWWQDTGGVDEPECIVWYAFEPGIASFGLSGVVDGIGRSLFGADFAPLENRQRLEVVKEAVQRRRLLLLWDNFEAIYSMPNPDGVAQPLTDNERTELTDFLTLAASGASAVIVTSRTPEEWLGDASRVSVAGFSPEEADEYSDVLLEPYPEAAPRRNENTFAALLTQLDGHPMSMRLILPHLATTNASNILAALRDNGGAVLGDEGDGRANSLSASLSYSYRHLTDEEQQLLVATCTFQGVADIDVLHHISRTDLAPLRFRGRSFETWQALLDKSARLGLLTALDSGMYAMHPALPPYLAEQWRRQVPETYADEREATELLVLESHAPAAEWLAEQIDSGDAEMALHVVHCERQTMRTLLASAIRSGNYPAAYRIAATLIRYWRHTGLDGEQRGWADRICHTIEASDHGVPELDSAAGALWLLAMTAQAELDSGMNHFEAAEATYRRIGAEIARMPDSPARRSLMANQHHNLGVLAMRRGDNDAAEEWFQRSRRFQDQSEADETSASNQHQLGMAAQRRGDLDAAEQHYTRAAGIFEQLGNRSRAAATYHQLGVLAQMQGDLDDAEELYRTSLEILDQLGDQPRMAISYGGLGMVELERGQLAYVVPLALVLMSVRVALVHYGLLFGTARILLVDVVISAILLLTAATVYLRRMPTTGNSGETLPSALGSVPRIISVGDRA